MTGPLTRHVGFAGARVRVDWRGPLAGEVVKFLFRDVRDEGRGPPQARFAIEDDVGGGLTVRLEDRVCCQGATTGEAAQLLQEAASQALAKEGRGGLLVHAGAVSRGGRTLLLPGKTGSGKTTLTARLVERGCRYLTDELVFLPEGRPDVEAFPRPLRIKASGRGVLPAANGWVSLEADHAALLRPPEEATPSAGELTLAAIVFPRFREGALVTMARVSAAECGLRLMGALLNGANLEGHGFPQVAAVARAIPGYVLEYGDSRQASADALALIEE